MCGLVGIVGDLEHKDEAAMRRLLFFDYFRGTDSTGFAAIKKKDREVSLVKVPSHPLDLFDMGKFKSALSGYQSSVFLGHNRAATRGVVNHANAHPFQVDHIVGAHNGTLDWSSERLLKEKLGEDFSVDSLAVFTAIAKMGAKEALKHLKGAWSLTWVDLEKGTFNLLRNKERPMWYCYLDDGKVMMYASEWRILDAAIHIGSSGEGYRKLVRDKEGNAYFPTSEDLHYSVDINKMLTEKGVTKFKVQEMKGGEKVPVYSYTSNNNRQPASDPFRREPASQTGTTTNSRLGFEVGNPDRKAKGDNRPKTDVILHESSDTDPFAGQISRQDFEALAQYGCSFCSNDIHWEEAKGVAIWQRDDIILCKKCSPQNDDNNRLYILANPL